MRKTIDMLLIKMQQTENGKVTGGFLKVRGGYDSLALVGTNATNCDNKGTCGGTNEQICTNNKCPDATNNSSQCSNTGSCYY